MTTPGTAANTTARKRQAEAAGVERQGAEGDAACMCAPCPGRGTDGHGLTHCAECCYGSGVEADVDCPTHGLASITPSATPADQPTEAAPVADAAGVEALLLLAERVCALVGWTATGDSVRDKALTEAWMEWARTRPHLTGRKAWPDLDDEGIAALAARRDATRAATLRRIARAEADRG